MVFLSETLELKVMVEKKIYYNNSNSFGIFAAKPLTNKDKVEINKYNNITIKGTIPELTPYKEYELLVTPHEHPQYGKSYEIVMLKFNKPTTVEEQQAYIRTILNEKYAEAIIRKYPNHKIVDMIKDGTFDYSGINGIKEATFQKIKRDLLSNLEIQDILIDLKDLKLTHKAARKILNHFGSAMLAVKKIKENIYCLTDIHGFGFKTVDEFALNRGDDKENYNRIIAGIKYLLNQEEQNGHSWISMNQLLTDATKLLSINKSIIQNTLNELNEPEREGLFIKDHRVALYRNYYYEKRVQEMLFDLLHAPSSIYIKDIDQKIKDIEKENRVTYTEEQKRAIRLACENNIFILNGKAGVGKTFTLKAILGILKPYNHVCCALSGKAAKIMSSHGLNAMTIHRALEYHGDGFYYGEEEKLPYDIIVIDEAGMNSNYIMYRLILAIQKGSKVIIVGDSGQLSPIGAGNVFSDLIQSKAFPMQELTIVQRQVHKSGILSCANQIRDGKQIIEKGQYGKNLFGELKDFVVLSYENRDSMKKTILDISKKYKNRLNEFQVICGVKTRGELSVKQLNIELQKVFNPENKDYVERHGYIYKAGDKVIQNGNNYADEVFNGTIGYVTKVNPELKEIHIQFEDKDEVVCYKGDDIDQIELAYAITCHKSQGSTIPIVLFVVDYGAYTLLSRQFVYTGITRASKGCIMLCENKALRYAIRTDHSGNRNTFLKDMLRTV